MNQYTPPIGGNLCGTHNAPPPTAPAWLAEAWNSGRPGLSPDDSLAGILHRILTTGELPARCVCGECMTGGAPLPLIEYLREQAFCGDGVWAPAFTVTLEVAAARAMRSHYTATLAGINAHAGAGDYLPAMTDEGLSVAVAVECLIGVGILPADLYAALASGFAYTVPAVLSEDWHTQAETEAESILHHTRAELSALMLDGRAPWQGSHGECEVGA